MVRQTLPLSGLSPRGRGNLNRYAATVLHRWSIPAWAGEPRKVCLTTPQTPVYPRVGGGTTLLNVGGEFKTGLSPRGRGNRMRPLSLPLALRSIPAWAGEPQPLHAFSQRHQVYPRKTVYPRVGGGTQQSPSIGAMAGSGTGLSPRGRGVHSRGYFQHH